MLTFFSRFDAHSHSKTCFFLKFFTSCPRPQLQLSTKIMIIHQMESRKLWSTGCCFNGLYMWDIMEYIIYIYTYHIYIHTYVYLFLFIPYQAASWTNQDKLPFGMAFFAKPENQVSESQAMDQMMSKMVPWPPGSCGWAPLSGQWIFQVNDHWI